MHVASQYIWLHCAGHSQKPIHIHQNCDSRWIFREVRDLFLYTHYTWQSFWELFCASILDLQVSCMLNLILSVVIGSGIFKNLYIDTKSVTLGGFLEMLEPFFYIFHRLGCHFGRHFGGHLGFTGHLYI